MAASFGVKTGSIVLERELALSDSMKASGCLHVKSSLASCVGFSASNFVCPCLMDSSSVVEANHSQK